MTIIFTTQEIQDKAKKYGFSNNLQEYVEKCRGLPFKEAFSLFKIRHPYLYDRIANFRLIAKVEVVNEIEIICLLDMLKKGDKDAEDFNADHFRFGQDKLEKLLDHNALDVHVQAELEKGIVVDAKKKSLTNELYHWLEPFEHAPSADDLILESHQWVNKFQSKEYEKHWAGYYEIVKSISSRPRDVPVQPESRIFVADDEKSGRSVLYTKYLLEENQVGSESLIFLLDLRKPDESISSLEALKDFEWVIGLDEIIKNIDVVAPYAGRSYLSLVLADEDLWYQTEMNEAANPALSAEELALLSRVRHAPLGEAVLPIFINGRAGSGKSTMLYHLFSDYLHKKASLNLDGEMLFLTYSDSLLKTARENVRKLVQARADLNMTNGKVNIDEVLPKYDEYFQPFLGFVQKHVLEEILVKEFAPEKFVDFRTFKRIFSKYEPNTRLSPDVCWHVIRTFIKGYSLDGYLTPDDYEDLPQKEKSVSHDTFTQIYKTVWERYKDSEYWDTQDIVRRVIKEEWIQTKYSVVFCDESQDFTRLELEFILKLLVYQEYDLGWTKYIRLPFALAGDPFQTLNPTGFRWEALKASFYDEVVGNLDPYGRGNIDFDYIELSYNYRSLAPIVRLSNLFQIWREVLFGTSDVYPQKPWRDEHIIPPRLYVLNENISEEAFFNIAANSVVILPCEPGQEKEFVENDPLLLRLSKQDKYPIFQSPMTAKGLEYPRVILYGFGDACPAQFFNSRPEELHLENEYFLNKLYVAATRAMKSLIIVDSKTGNEKLWKHTLGQEAIKPFVTHAKNPKKWTNDLITGVTSGDHYEPHLQEVTQDPLEIARKLEESGQNDPVILLQASEFYHRGGDENKARHCKAKSMEADKNFKQAGDEFLAQGRHEDAERCYWKGESWTDLNIWHVGHEGGNALHKQTALLMVGDRKDKIEISNYVEFIVSLYREDKSMPVEQVQFQIAVQKVVDTLMYSAEELNSDIRKFSNVLKSTPSLQFIVGLEQSGHLLFEAEEYSLAIGLWDRSNSRDTIKYRQARAMTSTDKKEKVYWLTQSKQNEKIISLYESTEKSDFDKDALRLIADAYRVVGKTQEALKITWQTGDYVNALDIFEKLINHIPSDEANAIFSDYYHALLSNSQMDTAYDWYKTIEKQLSPEQRVEYGKLYARKLLQASRWVDAIQLTKSGGKSKRVLKIAGASAASVNNLIITEMARSEKIKDATISEKNEIVKYLSEVRIAGLQEWITWLPLEVMSAALEKTATMVDTLGFYDGLDREELFPEQKLFIRQRWAKVKSKYAEKLKTDVGKAGNEKDREKTARSWNGRKRELEGKLGEWHIDMKSIENLPEFPVIKMDEDEDFARKVQVDWQSPACRIVIGSEIQIMIDVKNGLLMVFPPDAIQQKTHKGKISFHSEKLPISGEITTGKSLNISVNGKLQHDFILDTN